MRWKRQGEGFLVEDWTPDLLAERHERQAWAMRNSIPWKLTNGQLVIGDRNREDVASLLHEAMNVGRGEWKSRMRDIRASGVPTAAEGTYGALGAYPLPAAGAAVTATTTAAYTLTTGQSTQYMPVPANGLLAPQAYRFVITGLTTLTATAANYTWTLTIGNSGTVASNVSLGASAAVAKTATAITNGFWVVKGDLTVQSVGLTGGSNARMVGAYQAFLNGGAVGGAYTSWLWGTGATAASFDSTVGPGGGTTGGQFNLAVTASAAATDTFTVQQVHFMDWN